MAKETIHIVAEVVYGNEGNPSIRAFRSAKSARAHATALRKENDSGPDGEEARNADVLIVRQSVALED